MSAGAALLAVGLSALALAAEIPPPTDLELYAASSLAGLHSHPVGWEGARLDRAERAINRRRSEIRDWLVEREGEEAVARVDDEIEESVSSVYWTGSRSLEEEWADIGRARRALGRLERRRRRSERRD